MPVIDKGTHRCQKCGRKFEWEYNEPVRDLMRQSCYRVETLPDPKLQVHSVSERNGIPVYWKNCPHCDYDNEICPSQQVEDSE